MNIRNEQGSALLLTIVVTVVLLFLGGILGLYGQMELKRAGLEEANMQAYYLARSGADAVAQAIIDHPDKVQDLKDQTLYLTDAPELTGLGLSSLEVEVSEENASLVLTSTAVVRGLAKEVRLTLISEQPNPLINQALFATQEANSANPAITIQGAEIIGSVESTSWTDGSIYLNQGSVSGTIRVGQQANLESVVRLTESSPPSVGYLPEDPEYNTLLPVFEEAPSNLEYPLSSKDFETSEERTYVISEDARYDSLKVTSGRTLKIDLNRGTRILHVRNMDVQGNIVLENPGDNGRLILFVDNKYTMGGGWRINYDQSGIEHPERLTIYYGGKDEFGGGEYKFSGNVIIKDAGVAISSSAEFVGNILTAGNKPITISGGNGKFHGVVYAPNAPFSLLTGRDARGAVVSSRIMVNWDSTFVFDPHLFADSFPPGVFLASQDGNDVERVFARGIWQK